MFENIKSLIEETGLRETFSGNNLNLIILCLFGLCILPVITRDMHIIGLITAAMIFIIYASSWNLLAYSGQGSLGHATFWGAAGYVSILLAEAYDLSPWVTILIGALFSAFLGFLIGLTCVRLREWFLAMVTFGFAIIAETLVKIEPISDITRGDFGLWTSHKIASSISLFGFKIPAYITQYYVITIVTIIVLLVIRIIWKSKLGIAFAAIRENELEARTMGINVPKYKLIAFVISTFLAGLAGGLRVHYWRSGYYICPETFHVHYSFLPIIFCVSGGLNTVEGPILGTLVVYLIFEEGLRFIFAGYERFVAVGLLMILIVIFLPKGLVSILRKYIPSGTGVTSVKENERKEGEKRAKEK